MSYYGYQYKQQCYIPGGMKCPTPVFAQQCHPSGVVKCVSCPPCAPTGTKVCTVRKTLQSPRCSPCSSGCVETHVVEGHSSSSSSSCGSRCLNPCTVTFSQPQGQGREHLCLSQCGQAGVRRCPQVCARVPQVCARVPQVCAPVPQVCVPAPQVCARVPQVCVPAPQVCVPAPQVCPPAPQVCPPAPLYQHSSYPYSYQWSNSYQYNCGQQ